MLHGIHLGSRHVADRLYTGFDRNQTPVSCTLYVQGVYREGVDPEEHPPEIPRGLMKQVIDGVSHCRGGATDADAFVCCKGLLNDIL